MDNKNIDLEYFKRRLNERTESLVLVYSEKDLSETFLNNWTKLRELVKKISEKNVF